MRRSDWLFWFANAQLLAANALNMLARVTWSVDFVAARAGLYVALLLFFLLARGREESRRTASYQRCITICDVVLSNLELVRQSETMTDEEKEQATAYLFECAQEALLAEEARQWGGDPRVHIQRRGEQ